MLENTTVGSIVGFSSDAPSLDGTLIAAEAMVPKPLPPASPIVNPVFGIFSTVVINAGFATDFTYRIQTCAKELPANFKLGMTASVLR